MKTVDQIIDDVIKREGSKFTNDPADRGGPTKYGITLRTLQAWRRTQGQTRKLLPHDVKNLTREEAVAIYRQRYVKDPGFDRLHHSRTTALLVDTGVLHGPKQASRWFQKAIGAKQDGIISGKTLLKWVALRGEPSVYNAVLAERIKKYGRICKADPSQLRFINGWLNRALEFLV